jgi:predicted phosphoserine aminotransferase
MLLSKTKRGSSMPLKIDAEGSKLKLFTPGPVWVPERVLKEMAKPNDTHRSRFIEDLIGSIKDGMKKIMFTKNDVLLFASSGTGAMEACMRNLLGDKEKGVVFSCGPFGERWHKIGKANGKDVDLVKVDNGKGINAKMVAATLEKADYKMVAITHNETSCGVTNPIYEIAPIVKKKGALLCVDAVSSLGGIKIEVDKLGIDVCLTSSQKCFAVPPGLAWASVSDTAYAKAKTVPNRGVYFDLVDMKESNDKNNTPTTPPIPQMRALDAQVTWILEKEGLENRFARHAEMGRITREWAKKEGFTMFSEDGYQSNTVSVISNNLKLDFDALTKGLQGKGFKIVNGYADMKGKNFRIAHMGELTPEDTKAMLATLSEVKKSLATPMK